MYALSVHWDEDAPQSVNQRLARASLVGVNTISVKELDVYLVLKITNLIKFNWRIRLQCKIWVLVSAGKTTISAFLHQLKYFPYFCFSEGLEAYCLIPLHNTSHQTDYTSAHSRMLPSQRDKSRIDAPGCCLNLQMPYIRFTDCLSIYRLVSCGPFPLLLPSSLLSHSIRLCLYPKEKWVLFPVRAPRYSHAFLYRIVIVLKTTYLVFPSVH